MKYAIFAIPLVLFVELAFLDLIFSLVSEPSDIAVIVGLGLLGAFAAGNYFLIKFLHSKLKRK